MAPVYPPNGSVEMADFAKLRERMVERQIAGRGISDPRILAAFRSVPREEFVPQESRELAYEDSPLPIEADQTISQPYIVAAMIEAAEIAPGDRVLEVGAGSGYAAALLAELADQVFAIERHETLAKLAGERMERLGFENVSIYHGDGTGGLSAEAPFDAILCSASGSHVPQTLLAQLKIGGRLVMPVGEPDEVQTLIKVTRTGEEEYEQEELAQVRFVPLIGAHAWNGKGGRSRPVAEILREAAEPLPDIDDPAFADFFERFADSRVILLGEASHGTSEFYRARAAISKRLIQRHGFNIVAVEADWPDAASIDRYVRHRPGRDAEESPFSRFPTWMWRNREVDSFVRWLRAHNQALDASEMTGFYGLDLYNMGGSIRAVIDYLDDVDPETAAIARERYGCLMPWSSNPQAYGRAAVSEGFGRCESQVLKMLRELQGRRMEYAAADADEWLDAAANARLVKNAEEYYRVMYHGAAESWNLRDTHMYETLCQILDAKGPASKAIVWAHNSHIGNAAHTEMGQIREELNIGQLVKERFGEESRLIGFGTHCGTVAAATYWDGAMEVKQVRPSLEGSYERVCHDTGLERFLLDMRRGGAGEAAVEALLEPRLERFIGVIYRPETERWSHYAEAVLPNQFDAWVWFDETEAVTPLPGETQPGEDDMYPFGL
jgi:protein-L-isoaspartate(D-aspartate) O-methyltransferase